MIKARINADSYTRFSYIFRTDTNNYAVDDIKKELDEWKHIFTELLGFRSNYNIDRVQLSDRLTTTLAKTGRGYIVINTGYLRHHGNPDNFHSTLAHEVVHTLEGCFNHGENFKLAGRRLMATYDGVSITRTGADAGYLAWKKEHGVGIDDRPHTKKYKIVCPKCGQTIYRERLSKLVKNPSNFRCGRCYSQFKVYEIEPDGTEVQRIFVNI